MIHLEMTAEVSSIRAYDQEQGYERRIPYLAIVTVTHLNDTTVYLHGAVGKVGRETWAQTLDLLRARGIKDVMMERRGRMRTFSL